MSTVRVGENESLDNAIRRFKRKCARDGIIGDLRKREAYEKPSVRRKPRQLARELTKTKTKKETTSPFRGHSPVG